MMDKNEFFREVTLRICGNLVERELILNPSGPLDFKYFKRPQLDRNLLLEHSNNKSQENIKSLEIIIANHIKKVLDFTAGRIHGKDGAAELLGVNASTLRNRMNKLGIKYKKSELYK